MNVVLPNDDSCQMAGEGITRTAQPGSRLWPFEITFPGQPMRGTVRATNRRQAESFLRARHPQAQAISVGRTGR